MSDKPPEVIGSVYSEEQVSKCNEWLQKNAPPEIIDIIGKFVSKAMIMNNIIGSVQALPTSVNCKDCTRCSIINIMCNAGRSTEFDKDAFELKMNELIERLDESV